MSDSEAKFSTQKAIKVFDGSQDGGIRFGDLGTEIVSVEKSLDVKIEALEVSGENSKAPEVRTKHILHRADAAENILEDGEGCWPKRGFGFWLIMLALAVTSILSALEGTIVSTALPTIVDHLGGAELFIWTVNGYFLTR
jgi:hypothetical protein